VCTSDKDDREEASAESKRELSSIAIGAPSDSLGTAADMSAAASGAAGAWGAELLTRDIEVN